MCMKRCRPSSSSSLPASLQHLLKLAPSISNFRLMLLVCVTCLTDVRANGRFKSTRRLRYECFKRHWKLRWRLAIILMDQTMLNGQLKTFLKIPDMSLTKSVNSTANFQRPTQALCDVWQRFTHTTNWTIFSAFCSLVTVF